MVQVRPWDDEADQFAPWSGSGTIISPDGYILTNFHVIGDLDTREFFQFHAIYMTDPAFTDQPPEMRYWAQYVDSDPTHDLAVLKIVEFADETPVPSDLTFTSVEVGDSNDLFPGDTITIVGYPSISGSTITFTAGLMSGWLGEDFESGGKQWLKTDAKISHGNSGGAAFNAQGQLIGVPTAGITVQYEELDVEERAFVRPISLAWAVIGPDVANVTRASGVSATTPPPAANNNVVASRVGDPSGECDSIVIGQAVSGTIAGIQGEETVVFHTYVVPVPAGTPAVTISVTGNGADLDLAVKSGGPILDYDDVDHLDVSEDPNPVYVIQNPSAGPVYFDVLNLLTSAANYTAQVTIDGAAGANPLGAGAAGNPLGGQPAPIDVPSIESGIVSDIAFGQQANGELAGVADANSYHTFIVTVPQGGVARLVVRMVANEDLNLAMKFGTEIQTYADDGDWTYRDNSTIS